MVRDPEKLDTPRGTINKPLPGSGAMIPIHLRQSTPNQALWDKWVNEEYPRAFGHLALARDGGFSEVKALYVHSRWISSVILIFFIVYNVYYVADLDYSFIADREATKDALESDLERINGEGVFYLSRHLIHWAFEKLELSEGQIPDSLTILGFLELVGLVLYLLSTVWYLVTICVNKGFKKWFSVQAIYWDIMPALSMYSAMKLLNVIVPSIFCAKLFEKINDLQHAKSKLKWFAGLLFWLLTVVVSFVIGFDTFLLKLRVVSIYARQNGDLGLIKLVTNIVLPVLQFLLQCLGVVQLGAFVQKRLYVFIFGGEDGILQPKEVEIMETWMALLVRRICRETTCLQFFAVMTSFSDEDFQSLVLNENLEKKRASIGN